VNDTFFLSFVIEQTAFYLLPMINSDIQQLNWMPLYKGMMMKTLTGIVLISAILIGTFAVSAAAAIIQASHYNESELKSMDTNKDNKVSKEEFMAYSELAFSKMELTDGMISLKSKAKSNSGKSANDASSLNSKPIGTTADNPGVNKRDAVNGKNY
jgi:hypothetical protein